MPHKLRKIRKQRGSRTHGWGQVGQHRKTSQKGMRNVGRHKHGWSYILRYEPDYFSKKGFTSPRSLKRREKTINVGELEQLAQRLQSQNLLTRENEKTMMDLSKLGYTKLLGSGQLSKPFLIKIQSYSEIAAKKIEESGGQLVKEQQ